MLKEVNLAVKGPNLLRELASKYNCQLNLVDCKNFNSQGMSLLIEVKGADPEGFLTELKSVPGIKRIYPAESEHADGILAMVIMDAPAYCSVSQEAGAFCVTCPFKTFDKEAQDGEASWKLLVRDANALSRTIDLLKSKGVFARVKDLSEASHTDTLTKRQRQVMIEALKHGYFDFPRKKDLSTLASELNIRPSTLSEIMRRAESKIAKYYIESISTK